MRDGGGGHAAAAASAHARHGGGEGGGHAAAAAARALGVGAVVVGLPLVLFRRSFGVAWATLAVAVVTAAYLGDRVLPRRVMRGLRGEEGGDRVLPRNVMRGLRGEGGSRVLSDPS